MLSCPSLLRRAVWLALLAAAPLAAPTPVGLPAATLPKVEAALLAEMKQQGIPGLSVAIVTDHQLRWANGYGLADVEKRIPATATTVYRIASLSKPITAVAVLRLAEQGRLDLDAPIQTYCPAFPPKPWPITARQLLGHLGGIRHYQSLAEIESTRHYRSVGETLALFKDNPLRYEPGTQFLYSTYGYSLLGCGVEGASGMNYLDYVRENIFRPAGMDRTGADSPEVPDPQHARGYRRAPTGELRPAPPADLSNKIPGGGLASSAVALARFASALEAGSLLKKETLEQMWTPQQTRAGRQTSYGLGWVLSERNGQKEVWHPGTVQGASAFLYLLPDKGFAVVVLSNLEGVAERLELARRLADLVLQ